ncbi:MAG: UDP-N-acetylmuramoyl-L-alanyl-D-glutamate--2,6-diaminopimelate ligase [Chloroflexota bacterium]
MNSSVLSLKRLWGQIPIPALSPVPDVRITGIAQDSRNIEPGFLFVAIKGGNTDGHGFIPQAILKGAVAVAGTQTQRGLVVPYIQVEDSRLALAYLAAAFYGFPARKLTVIGVTGTDGKTTVVNLIHHILLAAGLKAGMISTVNAVIGEHVLDTGLHITTPESPDVQRYLSEMVTAGLTHVVIEATSHGLAQERVAACEFDLGVVTNITHEHLDFHGSYEEYRSAKGKLFKSLEETTLKQHGNYRVAVLNSDDDSYSYLKPLVRGRQVTYGLNEKVDVSAKKICYTTSGINFVASCSGCEFLVESRLVGAYNVMNCLAAISATVVGLGLPIQAAQEGISRLTGIPGRMEVIDLGQDFLAIVDFAHTPNALYQALKAAREMTTGQVIAVFGSAGLRDRAKRRMMAETSAELADKTVLTAEDPRTESLEAILEEMAKGMRSRGGEEGKTFWRVPDRGEAIRFALSQARKGDVVIACGKGHEQSMCFGETEYPWDDRLAMRAALAGLLGITGPQMPYLPTQIREVNRAEE